MNSIICRRLTHRVFKVSQSEYLVPQKRTYTARVEMDSSNMTFALAPDFIPDNPTNNPAMRIPIKEKNEIPYLELTPENVFRSLLKNTIIYSATIDEMDSEAFLETLNLSQFLQKLEPRIAAIDYSQNLLRFCTYKEPQQYNLRCLVNIERTINLLDSKRFSLSLFKFVEQLKDREDLTDDEKLLLKYWTQQCDKFGGVDISLKKRKIIRELLANVRQFEDEYEENVEKISEELLVSVEDSDILKTLPEILLSEGANVKGLKLPPIPFIYHAFLRSCPKSSLRYRFWYSYNNRASLKVHESNSLQLEEIRFHRAKLAKACGYSNYAEMAMADKMAESVDAAKLMIDSLHEAIKPLIEKEIESLNSLNKTLDPLAKSVQLWDLAYLRSEALARVTTGKVDLSRYLSLENVLVGFFSWLKSIFNISIEEIESSQKISEHVKYFQVVDHDLNDKVMGHFYFDPFAPDKLHVLGSQAFEILSRCTVSSTTPLCSILLYKKPPAISGGDIILNITDFISLIFAMGKVLSAILNQRVYHELSTSRSIPIDRSYWFSNMLVTWALNDYRLMEQCAIDRIKKKPLSKERFEIIRYHLLGYSGMKLQEELFLSAFDLAVHMNTEFWKEILKEVWTIYMDPMKLPKEYNYPLSFRELASTRHAAGYYSKIWSQMIGADCYSKFVEAEENGTELTKVAKEFKKVLYESAPLNGAQLFKEFRGRDPSIDPFLEYTGLLPNSFPLQNWAEKATSSAS